MSTERVDLLVKQFALTFDQLEKLLVLPEGVKIERVFMSDNYRNVAVFQIVGHDLPDGHGLNSFHRFHPEIHDLLGDRIIDPAHFRK